MYNIFSEYIESINFDYIVINISLSSDKDVVQLQLKYRKEGYGIYGTRKRRLKEVIYLNKKEIPDYDNFIIKLLYYKCIILL
jgi:hypothetical protein